MPLNDFTFELKLIEHYIDDFRIVDVLEIVMSRVRHLRCADYSVANFIG